MPTAVQKSDRSGSSAGAQQGQIIMEMLLLMLVLLLMIFMFVEICLIAIEKHETDRISRYAARVWAVKTDSSGAGWDAEQSYRAAAGLRGKAVGGGFFYAIQSEVGSGSAPVDGDGLDGTTRTGVRLRTALPVIMPFTDKFLGHSIKPVLSLPLADPTQTDPPFNAVDGWLLRSFGLRSVVRAIIHVPMRREPIEHPGTYDNDYDDNDL